MNTKGHEEKKKTNTDLFHHRGTQRNTENISLVERTTSILLTYFFNRIFLSHRQSFPGVFATLRGNEADYF